MATQNAVQTGVRKIYPKASKPGFLRSRIQRVRNALRKRIEAEVQARAEELAVVEDARASRPCMHAWLLSLQKRRKCQQQWLQLLPRGTMIIGSTQDGCRNKSEMLWPKSKRGRQRDLQGDPSLKACKNIFAKLWVWKKKCIV